jgi:hypothetical protein
MCRTFGTLQHLVKLSYCLRTSLAFRFPERAVIFICVLFYRSFRMCRTILKVSYKMYISYFPVDRQRSYEDCDVSSVYSLFVEALTSCVLF